MKDPNRPLTLYLNKTGFPTADIKHSKRLNTNAWLWWSKTWTNLQFGLEEISRPDRRERLWCLPDVRWPCRNGCSTDHSWSGSDRRLGQTKNRAEEFQKRAEFHPWSMELELLLQELFLKNKHSQVGGLTNTWTCNFPDIKYLKFIRITRMHPDSTWILAWKTNNPKNL